MVQESVMPIVEAQRLSKQVASPEGELLILDDVSFRVCPGEAIAILGVVAWWWRRRAPGR